MTISTAQPPNGVERRTAQTVRSLFDRECRFEIPSYQRSYSWELKQLRQLVEDLMDHPGGTPYYYGHFIFESGAQAEQLLIIDGQQRLTTLVLFISTLTRELAQREGGEDGNLSRLKQYYLADRLRTVGDDQDAFTDLVAHGETADRSGSRSKRRLIDASRFFQRAIRNRDSETLVSWLGMLEDSEITTFTVYDKPQAAQIFTLQNSRGKDLTGLEKLKAYLMFGIYLNAEQARSEDEIAKVERSFTAIYRHIENLTLLNEDTVLGHHDRAYSQHWDSPLENLKRDLNASERGDLRVQKIIDYSKALAATFQHVSELEKIIHHDEVIADPVILDGYNSWPLLIKLYRFHGDALKSDTQIRTLLRNVEIVFLKLHFQHGRSSNDLIGMTKGFDGSSGKLEQLCEKMAQFVTRGFRWRSDFDQKVQNQLDGDYHYNSIYRYILWKYENDERRSGDEMVSPANYLNLIQNRRMDSTIEHIAPRNGDYTEEFRNRWINNLGNLLLMPRGMNSSLSDNLPVEKAKELDTSYKSHREVRDIITASGGWTEHDIKTRKDNLIIFIQRRWRIQQIP
ncbi:MAG: DUF262 domain-containing HNH endonuclease family protein [Verrucomicrobiota bacterium]